MSKIFRSIALLNNCLIVSLVVPTAVVTSFTALTAVTAQAGEAHKLTDEEAQAKAVHAMDIPKVEEAKEIETEINSRKAAENKKALEIAQNATPLSAYDKASAKISAEWSKCRANNEGNKAEEAKCDEKKATSKKEIESLKTTDNKVAANVAK